MDLTEIVWRAASSYSADSAVLACWDSNKARPRRNSKADDTLAQFITNELYDTFDADASEAVQISTAIGAMQRAADEIQAVARALSAMATERRAA